MVQPETVVLTVKYAGLSAGELAAKLRASTPPVIGRIEDDKVLLDLRTVTEGEVEELLGVLSSI